MQVVTITHLEEMEQCLQEVGVKEEQEVRMVQVAEELVVLAVVVG
jgi:hypothetical protein